MSHIAKVKLTQANDLKIKIVRMNRQKGEIR